MQSKIPTVLYDVRPLNQNFKWHTALDFLKMKIVQCAFGDVFISVASEHQNITAC